MLTFTTQSPDETFAVGVSLAAKLVPGDVVCLEGDLGAGKTLLVQGIAHGLKVTDDVTSPTFTLLNVYDGTVPLYHFDLYRLEDASQLFDIGFEEYTNADGIALIEWADKFTEYMPDEHLWITMRRGDNDSIRQITVIGRGERYQRLCKEWK